MPGYEIVGVNGGSAGWENTDALHCRTRGVMDFDMLFVDHRDVIHGEQAWQDSIPVVSKFIAYSGQNLKQDSLLVYYSVDGGTYQVAHMTATGNPDEYVGYIKGYQGESEIDYYVFGADESGHRYTQPVFAELDPHHFTMEAHEPAGELIITPDTLWFENMGEDREFVIRNETAEAVTIHEIIPEGVSPLNIWEPNLPLTLQVGQSVTVVVGLQYAPLKSDYLSNNIKIVTSLGERTVVAMVRDAAQDMGLYIFGAPAIQFDYADDNPQEANIVNGNYGTHTPIDIYSITIAENGIGLVEVEPQHSLPYTLSAGEYFRLDFYAMVMLKGYVQTTVTIHSSDRDLEFSVSINEDLLSVTELSAEAKLYPNPTNGQFTVEGANVAKVEVFNLVGQKVHEAEGHSVSIDATEWDKGIYLVNIIEQNGANVTKKLVVK